MPTTPQTNAPTRAFARVIGPFLVIVPGIVTFRTPEAAALTPAFFGNPALVRITGGILLFGGLLIISQHQRWKGASAILISLFGSYVALRGVVLLKSPVMCELRPLHRQVRRRSSGSPSDCWSCAGTG
jgi:hypothetical protein